MLCSQCSADSATQAAEQAMATLISEQTAKQQAQDQANSKQQQQNQQCKKAQQPPAANLSDRISAAVAGGVSDKQLDVIRSKSRQICAAGSGSPGQGLPWGCAGLDNPGNRCYMNSILQCINSCEDLVQPLLRAAQQMQSAAGGHDVHWPPTAAVGPALGSLLYDMRSQQHHSFSKEEAISAHKFRQAMAAVDARWREAEEQDGRDFMLGLLAELQV